MLSSLFVLDGDRVKHDIMVQCFSEQDVIVQSNTVVVV